MTSQPKDFYRAYEGAQCLYPLGFKRTIFVGRHSSSVLSVRVIRLESPSDNGKHPSYLSISIGNSPEPETEILIGMSLDSGTGLTLSSLRYNSLSRTFLKHAVENAFLSI